MSSLPLRRAVGLTAASALAVSALAALNPAPASAAADPRPVDAGIDWLSSQLTDGVIHNNQFDFDDLGLTVDVGLSLAELGETATVDQISAALAPRVTSYYTYDAAPGKTHVSAGSLAKAAAFVRDAGDDPAAYGGQDLVAQLESRVSADPASSGRIGDVFFPEEMFEADFSNTLGQAFAVRALDESGSTLTDPATDFLLAQQCSEGYFRLSLGATAAADCDADPAAAPNTDATALAIINLVGQTDDTDVAAAVTAAVQWLVATQKADGSFGSDAEIATANANSTGLAGWALEASSQVAPATAAARWLRGVQADDFGPCTTGLTSATGAIAYDRAALATGRSNGIEVATEDQFRRATAQALPGLRLAPDAAYAVEPVSNARFVRAGSTQRLVADDVAPGQTVCFANGASQDLVTADADGRAVGTVTMPAGTADRSYSVGLTDRVLGTVTFRVLGAKKLGADLRATVRAGAKQVLKVRGLAAKEQVTVFFRGKKVASRAAGNQGALTVRFPVGKRVGKATVKVRGQFDDRVAVRTFKVTKAR